MNHRDFIVLDPLGPATDRRNTLQSRLLHAIAARLVALLSHFFGILYPMRVAETFVNDFITLSGTRTVVLKILTDSRRSVSESRHIFGCLLEVMLGPVVPYYRWPAIVRYDDNTYNSHVFAYKVVRNGRIILASTRIVQKFSKRSYLIDDMVSSFTYRELIASVDAFAVVYSTHLLTENQTIFQDAELFKRKFNEPHPLRKAGCKRRRLE